MESLTEEIWDVVIVGTSLPQALLALNRYYGGTDAGLSLDEAQKWAAEQKDDQHAVVTATTSQTTAVGTKLASSKAYTLSLNPQIVYASGSFLPSMVTSRIHDQLDFLAVGSWWINRGDKLNRIPSTREDVFADDSLSRKDKMGLMKFLRSVVQDESTKSDTGIDKSASLQYTLSNTFKIPTQLQSALAALALAPESITGTSFATAVTRIRRHMTSMGYFGSGFAAVYPKYAGSAEISQVACRAGAVGGAIYLLDHDISSIDSSDSLSDAATVAVQFSNGTTIRARHVVGDLDNLPANIISAASLQDASKSVTLRSTMIVSDTLKHLFVQTADNSPTPAITMVFIDDSKDDATPDAHLPPIYLQIHSEDTGECPSGQCIIYASLHLPDLQNDLEPSRLRLESALQSFLTQQSPSQFIPEQSPNQEPSGIQILWSMSYTTTGLAINTIHKDPFLQDETGRIIAFPPRTQDIAFDDQVLVSVKVVWEKIMGDKTDAGEFMCFEDRNRGELD